MGGFSLIVRDSGSSSFATIAQRVGGLEISRGGFVPTNNLHCPATWQIAASEVRMKTMKQLRHEQKKNRRRKMKKRKERPTNRIKPPIDCAEGYLTLQLIAILHSNWRWTFWAREPTRDLPREHAQNGSHGIMKSWKEQMHVSQMHVHPHHELMESLTYWLFSSDQAEMSCHLRYWGRRYGVKVVLMFKRLEQAVAAL